MSQKIKVETTPATLRKALSVRRLLDTLYGELARDSWACATIRERLGLDSGDRPLTPGIHVLLELSLLGVAVRELSAEAASAYIATHAELSFPIGGDEHPSNRVADFLRAANAEELAELERRAATHASELLNAWLDAEDEARVRKLESFRRWRADLSSMAYTLGLAGRGELLDKRLRELDPELADVERPSADPESWTDEVAFWAVHDAIGWWCPVAGSSFALATEIPWGSGGR